jgi:hypothetical protein
MPQHYKAFQLITGSNHTIHLLGIRVECLARFLLLKSSFSTSLFISGSNHIDFILVLLDRNQPSSLLHSLQPHSSSSENQKCMSTGSQSRIVNFPSNYHKKTIRKAFKKLTTFPLPLFQSKSSSFQRFKYSYLILIPLMTRKQMNSVEEKSSPKLFN